MQPMLFSIRHTLRFLYDKQVFVDPHTIRLCPRSDPSQRLILFQLSVDPQPTGISHGLELDGNTVSHVWFSGTVDRVTITAVSEVQTLRPNPFDYILYPLEAAEIPMTYPEPFHTLLQPYRAQQTPAPEVVSFAQEVFRGTDGKTVPFLQTLCQSIAQDFKKMKRKSGDALLPSETLARKQGACRDLSLLFMEACKVQGLATRFVSGYSGAADKGDDRELHAWAEVFLPGGGWRGYDPSQGIAVADDHVALAASPLAQGAAPVQGTYRGTGVGSTLEYEVSIRVSHHSPQCPDQTSTA